MRVTGTSPEHLPVATHGPVRAPLAGGGAPGGPEAPGRLNGLVVEDNAAYRQSLHQLLLDCFPAMRIAEAGDAEEGLRLALARDFDLILTDIRLPGANGLELTKAIKAARADAVICVISSHAILEYRQAALGNGATQFIVKGESTRAEIVALVDSLPQPSLTCGDEAATGFSRLP